MKRVVVYASHSQTVTNSLCLCRPVLSAFRPYVMRTLSTRPSDVLANASVHFCPPQFPRLDCITVTAANDRHDASVTSIRNLFAKSRPLNQDVPASIDRAAVGKLLDDIAYSAQSRKRFIERSAVNFTDHQGRLQATAKSGK